MSKEKRDGQKLRKSKRNEKECGQRPKKKNEVKHKVLMYAKDIVRKRREKRGSTKCL